MGQDLKGNEGNLRDDIESLIGDANKVIKVAVVKGSQAAESVGESLKDTIKETLDGARSARDNVVMVRMTKESLDRVDELVEADIAGSRSEATAFLVAEGIRAKQSLFETMAEKLEQIRKTREELKRLLEDEREQTPETSEES